MYNILFGCNELAGDLLAILGLNADDFERFRDCYLSKDKERIIVYTRCGGSNRKRYKHVFDKMKDHDLYVVDYDDNFDNTYASIEFKVPDQYADRFKNMNADVTTGEEKFNIFLKSLEGDDKNEN